MELVKRTPEEQAKIDADRARPHCCVVLFTALDKQKMFQAATEEWIEQGMVELKARADAAGMIILSTSISTNMIESGGVPYLALMVLCQWASIEKIEEQQRRAFLAGAGSPVGRRGT